MKEVLLFGAGYYGVRALRIAQKYSDIRVLGYIDSNKNGGEIEGYRIYSLNQLNMFNKETPIVITMANGMEILDILQKLRGMGFENIFSYLDKTYSKASDFFEAVCINLHRATEDMIYSVETHLVDYCNLNCKGCAHFSPLFEKEIPNFDEKIEDIKSVKEIFGDIFLINLLGGEPLLNPQLKEYIEEIHQLLPKTKIQIVTNGILVPNLSDKILTCLAENDVTVSISEYEPTHRIIDKIKACLETYKIDYCIRGYEKKLKFNVPLAMNKDSIYPKTCISKSCINIWDGKISRCPTLMYVGKLNQRYGTHFPEEGVMTLKKENAKELKEKLTRLVPLCEYCVKCEIEWEQCKGEIKLEDFVTKE